MDARYEKLIQEVERIGSIARDAFFTTDFAHRAKDDGSIVTETDEAVEAALDDVPATLFPEDGIAGEEGAAREGTSGYVWHVDPIDGTDNFARRVPVFGLSLGRIGPEDAECFGTVHNPVTALTVYAQGHTLYANGVPAVLGDSPTGKNAFVGIGRGTKEPAKKAADYDIRKRIGATAALGKCGSLGSASQELVYTALGRIDGFLSLEQHIWDIAGGMVLARAAGAAISEYEKGVWHSRADASLAALCARKESCLFVSRPSLHDVLLEHIGDMSAFNA